MGRGPILITGKLRCPHCGGSLDFIKDSRPDEVLGFRVVDRRRLCSGCGKRSRTLEITQADLMQMVKLLDVARRERIAALQAEIAALETDA